MKTKDPDKYYPYRIGETVQANVSKIHDGHLIERGTHFIICAFPPKTWLRVYIGLNPNGYQYRHFVVGHTTVQKIVRLLLTEISKIK